MSTRTWRWLKLWAMGSGFCLFQLGCRLNLQRELDLLTSPSALNPLQLLPLSSFLNLFRILWI